MLFGKCSVQVCVHFTMEMILQSRNTEQIVDQNKLATINMNWREYPKKMLVADIELMISCLVPLRVTTN